MAQADDRTAWAVKPWAGTLAQMQRAAAQCKAKIEALAPYPPDYDPAAAEVYESDKHEKWMQAESARRVEVTVTEVNGFGRELTEIDDLDEVASLDAIEGIDMRVGGWTNSASAVIKASTNSGLSVSLKGPDRTWTAGLRHEVEEMLCPAGRMQPFGMSKWLYVPIGNLLFYALFISIAVLLRNETDWPAVAQVAVTFAVPILAVAPLALLFWKLPDLELLEPNQKPRWERWRRAAAASAIGVASLALGLAALLLGD